MPNQQPVILTETGRRFAASAVAVQAVVVDSQERVLLLSSPRRNPDGAWQTVSGALEAEEELLDGARREAHEELGAALRLCPVGVVHAHTFRFDDNVQFMHSIYYLFAYEGGEVQPGDDMAGSHYRWFSLAELADERVRLHIPRGQKWVLQRAVEMYRQYKDQPVDLRS